MRNYISEHMLYMHNKTVSRHMAKITSKLHLLAHFFVHKLELPVLWVFMIQIFCENIFIYEPCHEKTGFLHMQKKTQISFAVTAKLISAFVFSYIGSTIPLLPKSKILSLLRPLSVGVKPNLCRTWSETPKKVFSRRGSYTFQ